MKTNIFNTATSRVIILAVAIILGINLTSCSATDDANSSLDPNAEQVTSAKITFKYTVPEELLKYAEITVAYNNNEGTDAKWQPMLDPTFSLTYDINTFPFTAPCVMIYDLTNRPAGGVNVNWDIKMDVEITMVIGGKTVVKSDSFTRSISGDAGQGLNAMIKNVHDRTYGVKISKVGAVQVISDGQARSM